MPKYYVYLNGTEYVRTSDALLATMLFQQLCQQGKVCSLLFGKRTFATSDSVKHANNNV